jgi:hypothetical protein
VYLIFFIQKPYKASKKDLIIIPMGFAAPRTLLYQKPCKYNELKY